MHAEVYNQNVQRAIKKTALSREGLLPSFFVFHRAGKEKV